MSLAAPEGYSLGKRLRANERSSVYLAVRESDGLEVVLKSYLVDRNRSGTALRAQRELDALRSAAGTGVPRALDLLLAHAPAILVMERVPGIALSEWIARGPLDLAAFLAIALQLTEALARIHAAGLVHRDVTPDNIVFDPGAGRTHLIDFGLAKPLGAVGRSAESASLPESLAGTLAYIAPEQTGRMNRGCDSRSDLYSLGASFYHALTGRRPFATTDPLELIHAHMARVPQDPAELRPELPAPIARLLLRLLRKEPEERYPSARALHADLRAFSEQLAREGAIDADFVLGSNEVPDRPRFATLLRGREPAVARLSELFARCARGERAALLLQAEAGLGKSALVSVLRPALAETGGYLAIGSFDAERSRPYSGWVSAFESLVSQLLVESDERLARWKDQLLAGLGGVAGALVDLIPDLRFLIGETPPIPVLGPRETQARLALSLGRFLRACASREHPLVLFLDDLHWSDEGSRLVLEEVLGSETSFLFLIAACRPLAATDPCAGLLARLEANSAPLEVLGLAPLAFDDVLAMLADALLQPADAVRSLAQLVERRTGGSPLLVRQFVEHIHAHGLLRHQAGAWTWSLAEIAAADIPDGAVGLMTAKIHQLQADARHALTLASCIGNEFDLQLLGRMGGEDKAALERGVRVLCDAGLIGACEQGFRFVHDRIREAAQAMLSEDERNGLHYEVGCALLERTPDAERPQRIFAIVEHLNRGIARVPADMQMRVIELNLEAGKRALATGAGTSASAYLAFARTLFEERCWAEHWALGVELHLRSAEAAFQSRDYAEALRILDLLDQRPLARVEVAHCAAMRLRLLALVKSPEEAVRYMLAVLRDMGVRWPLQPTRLRARLSTAALGWQLRLGGPRNLLRPATDLDPRWFAPMLVIAAGGPVAIRYDLALATLTNNFALRRYLRSGYVTSPSFRLAAYAAYRYVLMGGTELMQSLGRTALEWNERIDIPVYAARTDHVIHSMIHPWHMRRRQALAPMEVVAEAAQEIGDPEFAYYARFLQAVYLALGGEPVSAVERRLRELAESVRRSRHWYQEPGQCHEAYRRLLESVDPSTLDAEIAQAESTAKPRLSSYASVLWMLVLCIHRRHDLAFAHSEGLLGSMFRTMPSIHIADYVLYRGLAAAALAARAPRGQRWRYRMALRDCIRRMRRWASGGRGPDFVHMTSFLDAERARLQGRSERARVLYDRAAERALLQEFPHHAALALESRASMLLDLRRETEAASALALAATRYTEWGAEAKANQLREVRSKLIGF